MSPQLRRTSLLGLIFFLLTATMLASPWNVEFSHVSIRDGLSNSQVNVIFKDSRGFVWIGTQSGLNRYDGYRFKTYFYRSTDKNSLPNNWISNIQETASGSLLIKTPAGYTTLDPATDTFLSDPAGWMQEHKLKGNMDVAYVDKQKNFVVAANGVGVYYINQKGEPYLFAFGKQLPAGNVSAITEHGISIILTYDNGRLVSIIPKEKRVSWISNHIPTHRTSNIAEGYNTYISRFGNIWVMSNEQTWIYNQELKRWFTNVKDYLQAQNYSPIPNERRILVKSIVEDMSGNLWMGTEHRGLIRISHSDKSVLQFLSNPNDQLSVADNTIQSLYLDPSGDLWVGTYKNGVSFFSPFAARFSTIPLGDVCTIVEDEQGRYWCGTNDQGVNIYDPKTGTTQNIGLEQMHTGTEVIVSSTRLDDGSLWFGSYNGGLACYRQGTWKCYRGGDGSGLANDNVWSLCKAADGRLVIGTLGGGVQLLNPATGKFTTFNEEKNGLASNYINSVSLTRDGKILAAHSHYYSIIDPQTGKIENFDPSTAHGHLSSPAINQAMQDSRGLIWLASASGCSAYDTTTHHLTELNWAEGTTGAIACSVTEDNDGYVWLVSDHGAARIEVRKGKEGWEYYTEAFNEYDGLQKRQFNFRSILTCRNGDILLGGQDGINIIQPKNLIYKDTHEGVLFSGLRLFDRTVSVGEEFNGRVVLSKSMNESHYLELQHDENAFTILLATNDVMIPATSNFQYRLKGFSENWQMTQNGQAEVTFTNLSPGRYTLEVRSVVRNGSVSDKINTLEIRILPPFYLTWWAFVIYVVLAVIIAVLVRRYLLRRQLSQLRIQRVKEEAERNRQMDEMKLTFFTNVSHELRTPLTLIVSPLAALMQTERDAKRKERLALVNRNAQRLFELVNQLLDFRKMEQKKQVLELATGNVVAFVHDITNSYQLLASRKITLTFKSDVEQLSMSFDPDKLRKVVDNLLSNAYKYTPENGSVTVSLSVAPAALNGEDALYIKVADTGMGISDEDKAHIFQPFFQASNHTGNPFGGSGVGLSLVADFVKMHDGTVSVQDNEGGGSLFIVALPIRHDASLTRLLTPAVEESEEEQTEAQSAAGTHTAEGKLNGQRAEVLLVDDAEDFLLFMGEVLSERYRVRTAHDGLEALECIEDHQPDFILSDVMMPRMDGRELCRKLKENEATAGIPFIMLTARMADTQVVEGMQIGADDYLTKPFNMDILFLRIENLLKWRQAASKKPKLIQPDLREVKISSVDETFVKAATNYVEDNLSNCDITVETMAEALNVSRVQLYRRVLSLTGSTPSEFIRTIRLRHAERWLRESQLTVSEIAYRVGFSSPRYFSKYFTEAYGCQPSQYAKQSEG